MGFALVGFACKPLKDNPQAKTPSNIEWVVNMLSDFLRSGALSPEQLGVRALDGKLAGAGGKGLVDLLVYKLELRHYFAGAGLAKFAWPEPIKARMRAVTQTIDAFRESSGYAYAPDFKKVSLSWRAGWSKSASDYFQTFFESVVFGYEYDHVLRACMKARKDASARANSQRLGGTRPRFECAMSAFFFCGTPLF